MAYRPLDPTGPASTRSTVLLLTVAAGWGALWLLAIPGMLLPLACVVPLAAALWARRRGALWWFAILFTGLSLTRASLEVGRAGPWPLWLPATLAAIVVGALVVHTALSRARRSATSAAIENNSVAAATEHEAGRDAEELILRNTALRHQLAEAQRREEFLAQLVRATARPDSADVPLARLMELALEILGAPADRVALLLAEGPENYRTVATAGDEAGPAVPPLWPRENSFAATAARERRVVATGDLAAASVLPTPLAPSHAVRAMLAAPFAGGEGILLALARETPTWSDEQPRRLERLATHFGVWLESSSQRERLLRLPRGRSMTSFQPDPAPSRATPSRILLVEDHVDTGQVISRLLQNAGHQVTHAHGATDALAHFRAEPFDLVISDVGLPDESGLALMEKLRQIRPGLPGICMSGYGQECDVAACKAAGFSEHLPKPVDLQRLHAAIARLRSSAVPPALFQS